MINISFKANKYLNNYRLSFYEIVDKFLNEDNNLYEPKFRKKSIIDGVS
jgi:vacuolar-type H+-ATPase subunit I/STV1